MQGLGREEHKKEDRGEQEGEALPHRWIPKIWTEINKHRAFARAAGRVAAAQLPNGSGPLPEVTPSVRRPNPPVTAFRAVGIEVEIALPARIARASPGYGRPAAVLP